MMDIEKYISTFPVNIQEIQIRNRKAILNSTPDAIEGFGYGMPTYKTNGKPIVYFAAFKNHIGFYATSTGHEKFASELSNYKHEKALCGFR